MNVLQFMDSLKFKTMPKYLSTEALKALWLAGSGDWEGAHAIAQDMPGVMGSWIHAYLHREEGDYWNAEYWYNRAGKPFPKCDVKDEFKILVKAGLAPLTEGFN